MQSRDTIDRLDQISNNFSMTRASLCPNLPSRLTTVFLQRVDGNQDLRLERGCYVLQVFADGAGVCLMCRDTWVPWRLWQMTMNLVA